MNALTLKSCLALASAALAMAHAPDSVAATLSTKRLNRIAMDSRYPIAVTRVCAERSTDRFGAYQVESDKLLANLTVLVERSGKDLEAFQSSYHEILNVISAIQKERYTGDEPHYQTQCESFLSMAQQRNAEIVREIAKLKPRRPASAPAVDCPLAADTYRQRVVANGKPSDLACYQKAGVRELEQVQQSILQER